MESRIAILVGFTYPNHRHPLPSNLVDVYRIYTFLVKQGFTNIHLLTDIDTDPAIQDYRQVILEGYVDANLLSFVTEMRKKNQHHLIRTPEDLTSKLTTLLKKSQCGFIHITGHGEDRGFVCSSGLVAWSNLQTAIFTSLSKKSRLLMILDVCHAWHFQLPYTLLRNKNRLSFVGTTFFPSCHFVLITTQGREAAATLSGSLVTKSLINLLEKGYDQYYFLRSKIEEDLTLTETLRSMQLKVGIYTSYPTLYRIWSWLWGEEKPYMVYEEGIFLDLSKTQKK